MRGPRRELLHEAVACEARAHQKHTAEDRLEHRATRGSAHLRICIGVYKAAPRSELHERLPLGRQQDTRKTARRRSDSWAQVRQQGTGAAHGEGPQGSTWGPLGGIQQGAHGVAHGGTQRRHVGDTAGGGTGGEQGGSTGADTGGHKDL